MNKKQAVKEVRDIILKYIFIEMEKMEDYEMEVTKMDTPLGGNSSSINITLYSANYDEIISIRIHTDADDDRIYVSESPDSLYKTICSYDNYKFKILDCR